MKIFLFTLLLLINISLLGQWHYVVPHPTNETPNAVAPVTDNKIIMATRNEIFISNDGGEEWNSVFKGSTSLRITDLFFLGDYGWAISFGYNSLHHLLKTTDGGYTWEIMNLPQIPHFNDIYFENHDKGFLFGDNIIYKTTDGGTTWSVYYSDSTITFIDISVKDNIIASARGNIYLSRDYGLSWETISIPGADIRKVGIFDSLNFIAASYCGNDYDYARIFKSSDGGINWVIVDSVTESRCLTLQSMDLKGDNAVIGLLDRNSISRYWITKDRGSSWTIKTPSVKLSSVDIKMINDTSFIGIGWGIAYMGNGGFSIASDIGISRDMGETFKTNIDYLMQNIADASFLTKDYGMFTSQFSGGINFTTDGGKTFTRIPKPDILPSNVQINTITLRDSHTIFLGTKFNGLFKSIDRGITWEYVNLQPAATNIGSIMFHKNNIGYLNSNGGSFKSFDGGNTWTLLNSNLQGVYFLDELNGWGIYYSYFYRSRDGGLNWAHISTTDPGITKFIDTTYGITARSFPLITTDGGYNWRWAPFTHLPTAAEIFKVGNDIIAYAGDEFGAVYTSLDTGKTWIYDSLWLDKIRVLTYIDGRLWAASDRGLIAYRDFDSSIPVELISFSGNVTGATVTLKWSTSTEVNNRGFEISRDGESVGFIAGNGTTSEIQEYRFIDPDLSSRKYNYELIQSDYDGKKKNIGKLLIEVNSIPLEYNLEQNYPNPFNPVTVINYSVAEQGITTIKLYNILGSEVAILVNEIKEPGKYKVELNGKGLSSGVYIYKMTSGKYSASKKLILLK